MNHTQIIIFGASGNLTSRKLIPGLFNLFKKNKLPDKVKIIGFSRREWTNEMFAEEVKKSFLKKEEDTNFDENAWSQFIKSLEFVQGNFNDVGAFVKLKDKLEKHDKEWNVCSDKIFYFSVQPSFYKSILDLLSGQDMASLCTQSGTKIVIEKPFGHDLSSAQELNNIFTKVFKEEQIYRIDHVLGKDTLLDIISFRDKNIILREVLRPENIDHIQISMLESIGVEDRGEFYEENGVIRDMVQNHVLQILAMSLLEVPKNLKESLPEERGKILNALLPAKIEDVVLGQYQANEDGSINGYQKEQDVAADSVVPTFVALKTILKNGKWKGVPIYMRSGKRLQAKYTEVNFVFKNNEYGKDLHPNIITFRIQPQEGVSINVVKDKSHFSDDFENISLDFCYKEIMSDAYENLLLAVMQGSRTHFVGIEEVLSGWRFVDPINKAHESTRSLKLYSYKSGSWGPNEGYKLLEKDGRYWMTEHFEMVCRV